MIVYVDKYKNPLIPDTQNGMDVHTPWEAENMDYIYQQILYRNRLLLEANGESCQIWKRKTSGTGLVCDNPNCGAYEGSRQDPNADCPRCVIEGTKILMGDYTQKKIEDVQEGDFVITHTGRRMQVTNTFKRRIDEDILEFKTVYGNVLTVTKEHPLYGFSRSDITCYRDDRMICKPRNESSCNKYSCRDHRRFQNIQFDFKDASDFKTKDYLSTPAEGMQSGSSWSDDAFMRLLGYYASEGCTQFDKKGKAKKVRFGFHVKETSFVDELESVVWSVYRRKLTRWTRENCINVSFACASIPDDTLPHHYCSGKARTKKLSRAVLDLPNDRILNFIGAYINGDGCQRKNKLHKGYGSISIATASSDMASQLSRLLLRCGIQNRIVVRRNNGGPKNRTKSFIIHEVLINAKDSTALSMYCAVNAVEKHKDVSRTFMINGMMAIPITDRREVRFSGFVYNIEVAGDNSYVANNIAVHNCFGTGYIGGWDYEGETLVRIAPAGLQFQITENGIMKASNPRSWTFPEPLVRNRDILIAFDRSQITQEKMIVDERVQRRQDLNTNFDSLSRTGVTRILKISNASNKPSAYQEKVDYALSNDGVLWRTAKRPEDFAAYFVTYQVATPHYRRFEITSVTTPHWRAVPMHQEMEVTELDVTHPAYNITMVDPDWTRHYHPFPVSEWFDRTY